MPARVSAGDLLLVALKMPPSRTGTYSNFTPVRCSIAGIASWLRNALGLPKSNRNCGAVALTAVSLKLGAYLYDPYHFTERSRSQFRDQPGCVSRTNDRSASFAAWSRTSVGQPAIKALKRAGS